MKVLDSARAFRERYATRAPSVFCGAKALAADGALVTSVTGALAFASASTEGICATPQELPLDAVRDFAEGFRKKFEKGCASHA